MKTLIVNDGIKMELPSKVYDLDQMKIKGCLGCISCWKKTPGICVFHDLEPFYRDYIDADLAIFFVTASMGFVSGRLKTLFDRMIPLFLPYTSFLTGESMHVPRYEKYPDIKVYYSGDFISPEEEQLFKDYLCRVFYQFHSKQMDVLPITECKTEVLL